MIDRLIYSMKGMDSLATAQVLWIIVGSDALLLTILISRDYQRLMYYKYLLALAGIGSITSTVLLDYEINGAKLWL